MPIPDGLRREHIEQAIARLDEGFSHPFGPSVDYDLVYNGRAYPPKAVLGVAASIATGRPFGPSDFSAGEAAGQTNATLRSLGFDVLRRGPSSSPSSIDVAFSAADCVVFEGQMAGQPWTVLGAEDQDLLRSIRSRLKAVAQQLAPLASEGAVPMSSVVSALNPNGRVPAELWSCIFPRQVPNKSYALQFAMIINAGGAEVCCCLGAGASQENAPEIFRRNQTALEQLRERLRTVPTPVQDSIQTALGQGWQLRMSWLREPGRADFDSLTDWLAFAASDGGAGASISRNVAPSDLEQEGTNLIAGLQRDLGRFLPLFQHAYATPSPLITSAIETGSRPSSVAIHPRLLQELKDIHADLTARGVLPSREALQAYYDTFKRRFGPEVLRATDGEQLLSLMHETGRDGMIYWLEFKDDDEFPGIFGSIAGGSALKYGIYRRKETGAWMTGHSVAQTEIATRDAIVVAQRNRDQLLAACDVLASFPTDASDAAYTDLQQRLRTVAPDLEDSAWGHKYLSLLFPDRLDDFHAPAYQRFHLIKLLQQPPVAGGRYLAASRFVALSRLLEWPMNHFTTVLNRRNGPPHRYWRVGTRSGDTGESQWPTMRDEGVVAIGWRNIGDLTTVLSREDLKEEIRRRLIASHPADPRVTGRATQQISNFCSAINDRDYVLACDGLKVLGVGRINGPYAFDESQWFPHKRPVQWLDVGEWQLPSVEGLQTTVHEYRNHADNLVAIESRVLEARTSGAEPPRRVVIGHRSDNAPAPLSARWTGQGVIGAIQDALERKGQVILYGPPGTGKTYWAERAATELAALWNYGRPFADLTEPEGARVFGLGEAHVRYCCFHPAYGYEDFIEGYRPELVGGRVHFAERDGIFKELCRAAEGDVNRRYYLIVDEINRGDIPRIFGELLTLLDKPKRGTAMTLPLSRKLFAVPPNVFVIGTMNTADRSIALLDSALRRRFGFLELLPDPSVLGDVVVDGIPLGPWLTAINRLITTHVGGDGRNLQIGHSYFMNGGRPIHNFAQLSRVLHEDILPLLEEYCYDDWETIERILKPGFVNVADRCFRAEIFEPNRQDALVQAILAATPEVSASSIAVAADAMVSEPEEPEEETA